MPTTSPTRKYHPNYTIADYSQWEGDRELWDGVPIAMTLSQFGPHQLAAARLARQIGNQLEASGCGCEVLHEIDWVVSNDTVIRPDLIVVCGGVPKQHLEQTPVLIAEVLSPSTEHKDRTAKYDLYESKGVRFYLLVDPDQQKLDAFALQSAGKYQELPRSGDSMEFELTSGCPIRIAVSQLFL